MEKYGFVYLWRDRKHKRYYLGSHWGTENDGYICSCSWMKNSYNRRPLDFTRRILKKIYTNRSDLYFEEQKWLDLIKPFERGKRYYNSLLKVKPNLGHIPGVYSHSPETIEKIKAGNRGRIVSEETKRKIRAANKKQFQDPNQRKIRSEKSKNLRHTQETKSIISKTTGDRFRNRKWITDGINRKRIPQEQVIPEGYILGYNILE